MLNTALILGLLGSLHCVGMCGPIAFLLPVDRSNTSRKTLQIAVYHLGRILSYSILGLLFGLLGKSLYLFGWQQQLSIAVGVVMILIVLIPNRALNSYRISRPIYNVISRLKSSMGAALKKKTTDTFFTIGFLNGFLPCGLVYMAVFGAMAAGNAMEGSLYMAVFGLGTLPLMTTAIYFGNFLTHKIKRRITKAVPVIIVLVGCLFILRGMGLGIPYLSPGEVKMEAKAEIECHTPVDDDTTLNLSNHNIHE